MISAIGAVACSGSSSTAAGSGGSSEAVGGAPATGGSSTLGGGAPGAGGVLSTGGTQSGSTGGVTTLGNTGGAPGTGGQPPATGGTMAGQGGSATGGSSSAGTVTGPCDIYAAASPATPCVAAYSTTRLLNSKYTGALYQVRKGGSSSGTGGTTQDIGTIAGGFADSATQDKFCGTTTCTFSLLYDQSGKGNNLKVAPAGCYTGGNASSPDYESSASHSVTISGNKVYSLYMNPQDGYRNDSASGMPTGSAAQGIYEVADGTRTNNTACCWDFGNASVNNCNQGTMDAIYFGTGYWGSGTGNGPWFMADFEGGVWAGGTGASNANNPALPSSKIAYAFGILKTDTSGYEIRVGNAQSGTLTTANNTGLPKTLNSPGGIILGIGGDNSNSSGGTFYEGVITAGKPSDATDALVFTNVQDAKYGQ